MRSRGLILGLTVAACAVTAQLSPATAEDIRAAGTTMVAFSAGLATELAALRRFLFARLYRHPRVMRVMDDAQGVVRDLVARYTADSSAMPAAWAAEAASLDEPRRARLVADFVAGMTDRFAIGEHRRLFSSTPALR